MTEQATTMPVPVEATVIESLTRADIDVQITTAKRYPRSIKKCIDTALSMATLDGDTARSCSYALPRDGKLITGPSARLAEIVASSWTNLRAATRIIDEGTRFVTAQAICHDMETNVAISKEVRRRITTKNGRRYGDDMIVMAANAAASIALRNAVFAVIPKAYWKQVYDKVAATAAGDASTLVQRRKAMVAWFVKKGVKADVLLKLLAKKALDDVGVEEVAGAQALRTSIEEGDTSVEALIASVMPQAAKGNGNAKPKTVGDLVPDAVKPVVQDIEAEPVPETEDATEGRSDLVEFESLQLKAIGLYQKLNMTKKATVCHTVKIEGLDDVKKMDKFADLKSVVDACLSA